MIREKEHETTIIDLNGRPIEVDTKVSELVILLNKIGLNTMTACENLNSKGDAVIQFDFNVTDDQIDNIIETLKDDRVERQVHFSKWKRYRKALVEPGIYESWTVSFRTELCDRITEKFKEYFDK